MWIIPRLVHIPSKGTDPQLSEEFLYIIRENSSRQYLSLLKQEWSTYSSDFAAIEHTAGQAGEDQYTVLQSQIGSILVTCQDKKLHELRTASIECFVPDDFNSEYSLPLPLLDIPNPKDHKWRFLKTFGVTVDDDLKNYLKILGKFDDNPSHGRIYPDHGILFKNFLKVKDAGLDVLIAEAGAFKPSTPLIFITDVFKELSNFSSDITSSASSSILHTIHNLQIFPLDEGGESVNGFGQVSSATSESEWYIADRPHLKKCFHGQVALLAFTVEDLIMMEKLILALNLQNRLLSKIAIKTPKLDGKEREETADKVYRDKVQYIRRIMPGSIPRREEILFQLNNLEVWKTEKLSIGWSVERIDPLLRRRLQEGRFPDDGLRALVITSTESRGPRVYLKNEPNASFLPLELAEQLAIFCGVPEYESLMLYILSQESSSQITDTLNRRGIPSIEERQKELEELDSATVNQLNETKNTGRGFKILTNSVDHSHSENKYLKMVTVSDDEDSNLPINLLEPIPRASNLNLDVSQTSQLANRAPSPNAIHEQKVAAVNLSEKWKFPLQIPPIVDIPSHPNYAPHMIAPNMQMDMTYREEGSTRRPQAKGIVTTSGQGTFERPRIVEPTVIWITNSQELPTENFSDRGSMGMVFPGRAQISQSGDCTIFLAKEPTKVTDNYTEFLGELFMRRHQVSSYERPSETVVILIRVFDMQSTARAALYVDPWSMYAAGKMHVHIQNNSYIIEIHDATPHVHFKGFEMGEHVCTRTLKDSFRVAKSYMRDSGELWVQRKIQDSEERLFPGSRQDELRGRLEHVSLESVRDQNIFGALSYVWGNSLKPFLVDLGGSRTVRITAALFFALKRLRRVWIVQELVLPRNITMLCGNREFHWGQIYGPAKLYLTEGKDVFAAQTVAPILSLGRLRDAYHNGESRFERNLLSLFKAFEHTGATRSRDKLYAFLGLACDSDDPGFDVDYAAPLEVVVQKYAGVFVQRGKGMELLYHAGISDSTQIARFPSWVPNWVTSTYPRSIACWQSCSGSFSAGLNKEEDIQFHPRLAGTLTCAAFIIDEIIEVGQISFEASDDMTYLKGIFGVLETITSYPTGEKPRDVLWKVPIGDARYLPDERQKEVDFHASYQALRSYMQPREQAVDRETEIRRICALAKLKQYLFRDQELGRLLWDYLLTAREFAERFVNAKVCITKKGYVGIVPGRTQVGSLVTVFFGSAVPFIVERTKDSGVYRLIGEGYIHGVMQKDSIGLQDLDPELLHLC
ncbi:hypothetical protein GQ44DRAFT_814110 [Phaeosphaeriaceae sp. PMI808]|nr:hypothetical protein GQ44DRAFT_814110 [Phaeosphaeriaceae sp. PMI808]